MRQIKRSTWRNVRRPPCRHTDSDNRTCGSRRLGQCRDSLPPRLIRSDSYLLRTNRHGGHVNSLKTARNRRPARHPCGSAARPNGSFESRPGNGSNGVVSGRRLGKLAERPLLDFLAGRKHHQADMSGSHRNGCKRPGADVQGLRLILYIAST